MIILWILLGTVGYVIGATLTRTLAQCSGMFAPSYEEDSWVNFSTIFWPLGLVLFLGWTLFCVSVVLASKLTKKVCPKVVQ